MAADVSIAEKDSDIQIRVTGIKETRRLLGLYAPDVKKALDKANKQLTKPLLTAARNNLPDSPLSGWVKANGWIESGRGRDLHYDVGEARRLVSIRQRGRSKKSPYSSVMTLQNRGIAASIFEAAGRQTESDFNTKLDKWFVVDKDGLTRVVWKAVVKDVGVEEITRQIMKNYEEAERELMRRIDAVK